MTDLIHHWPEAAQHLLQGLERHPEHPDCYVAEVDLSVDQLRELNLFEGAARHHCVQFKAPGSPEALKGAMNPLLGIGSPVERAGAAARIRISFHNVEPV